VFDHVTIRVADRDASRRFYETVLAPLGHAISHSGGHFDEWNDFGVAQAREDRPVTRGLHVTFVARSRAEVDAFWRAGTDAGYASDGEPGLRPEYQGDYYGAFLIDSDGNSAEAVYHGRARDGDNVIDHLWIRVADLDASKRFYETITPILGLRIANEQAERFHIAARDRSFTLVRGVPSENVHMAFPVPDDATVGEFHRVALAAGYRNNGPPGERRYHPGYYGAFVLDPDGNNVEAVYHGPAKRSAPSVVIEAGPES
jgi:catechol 2,3-dioxygenase-like lactoylglutathione lyase family enzyme